MNEKWLENNLEFFNINNSLDDLQFKAVIEFMYIYTAMYDFELTEKDQIFIDYLIKVARKKELINYLKHDINSLQGFLIATIFLKRFDESYQEDNIFFHIDNMPYVLEKTPYRKLDIKSSFEFLEYPDSFSSFESLSKQTILFKPTPVYSYNFAEMYSATHTIFYLTKLGSVDISSRFSNNCYEFIYRKLLKLLIVSFMNMHYDLVLEFILCFVFLNCDFNNKEYEVIKTILFFLNQRFNELNLIVPTEKYLTEEDSQEEVFRKCYHTNLVLYFLMKKIQ
ncbi:hypothetical protein JDW15_07930 [Aerococcaceae bacterium zg-ZJ1578]|nr:hypothetical protein [Aerococcaceae bacterium zg-1578]